MANPQLPILSVYLDASDACNMLCFQLGNTANGVNSLETRSWNIKATQFSCDFDNLAPDGCTQYFFGSLTDVVQTFNFNSGRGEHLADQDQSVCVRRERSYCRICWTPMQTDDFAVSGIRGISGVLIEQGLDYVGFFFVFPCFSLVCSSCWSNWWGEHGITCTKCR